MAECRGQFLSRISAQIAHFCRLCSGAKSLCFTLENGRRERVWTKVFEEWTGKGEEDLPEDFSLNHDHYIHGAPRKW
jgi:hypothetical protein